MSIIRISDGQKPVNVEILQQYQFHQNQLEQPESETYVCCFRTIALKPDERTDNDLPKSIGRRTKTKATSNDCTENGCDLKGGYHV